MGSSGTLLCCTAFVLVLVSSASTDLIDAAAIEQREVTFDIEMFMKEFPEQVIVSPPKELDAPVGGGASPRGFSPRGRRPNSGPRSHVMLDVKFPLGRPTSDNLQAICLYGDRRPRYPDSFFPQPGYYGQLRREASAVNRAESWFTTCCKGNQTWEREVTLCCATQAWEQSLHTFCEENSRVKDRQNPCCTPSGTDRLSCFQNVASNPNYEATEELPVPPLPSADDFHFDPSTCQSTVMTPHSVRGSKAKKEKKASGSQKVDISFPPGRPTAENIESLCQGQKLRPFYKVKCLPSVGYEWLARQAKASNRIEKGFKQCCKKKRGVLECAEQKWQGELTKYCTGENGAAVDFQCCLGDATEDRYSCFQSATPDPHYNMTSAAEELSLHNICDTHKIIKNKFPVGFPLKNFVNHCCPLPEQDKTACFQLKLDEMSATCSSKKNFPPAVRRCCRTSSPTPAECISKILMDAINKANSALRQKKKKRCPLS